MTTRPRCRAAPGRRRQIRKRLGALLAARLLAVALAALPALGGAGNAPPPFSASYQVKHGLFTVGRTRVEFRRPGDGRYIYRSHSRATGIAGLFHDAEVHEISEGRLDDQGLRPSRYRYRRTGNAARTAELRFRWEDGQVVNDVGEHPWRMDIPPATKDRVVGSLQLMHDLAAGRKSLVYPVADGGRLRTYRFEVQGEEPVTTELGTFLTLRVVRTDSEGRSSTVLWCAEALGYLPVRIEHTDADDADYRMELRSLEGFRSRLNANGGSGPDGR